MKFLSIIFFTLILTLVNSRAVNKNVSHTISVLTKNNLKNNPKDVINGLINSFEGLADNIKNKINNDATKNALSYMKSSKKVKVREFKDYYFFDGPGKDKAFIFYQGAMVDEKAYAEIMFKLAENGLDCFLMRMPYRLAFNDINMADKVLKKYKKNYKDFYIGGHSLGGAIAAVYAFEHKKEIKGLALMAAFSMFKLPESMEVVSFVASNDKVLVWPLYNYYLIKLPKYYTEINIKGGNHGQFGDYGEQIGDGKATISVQEQHDIVVEYILKKFDVKH